VEDGLVLGGLGLMAFAPIASFFVFLAIVIFAIWLLRKIWGSVRSGLGALRTRFGKQGKNTSIPDHKTRAN
jgi:hypothetical protein